MDYVETPEFAAAGTIAETIDEQDRAGQNTAPLDPHLAAQLSSAFLQLCASRLASANRESAASKAAERLVRERDQLLAEARSAKGEQLPAGWYWVSEAQACARRVAGPQISKIDKATGAHQEIGEIPGLVSTAVRYRYARLRSTQQ